MGSELNLFSAPHNPHVFWVNIRLTFLRLRQFIPLMIGGNLDVVFLFYIPALTEDVWSMWVQQKYSTWRYLSWY